MFEVNSQLSITLSDRYLIRLIGLLINLVLKVSPMCY